MKKLFFSLVESHLAQTSLCCLSLITATLAANSRCAYIFHNPKKPSTLNQLKNKSSF